MRPTTYLEAGVDLGVADSVIKRISKLTESTNRPGVLGSLGGFAGCFSIDTHSYAEPVLVSSTDGVGTKLRVADATSSFDTIGIDLVAMCVDDLVCTGAEPLFMLDYLSLPKMDSALVEEVVSGIAVGCRTAGCALIGGETAEHGYSDRGDTVDYGGNVGRDYEIGKSRQIDKSDEVAKQTGVDDATGKRQRAVDHRISDLAGFAVGVVERDKMLGGHNVVPGDILIGLRSPGLRSNGYSLARYIFGEVAKISFGQPAWSGAQHTLGEELMVPSVIYTPAVLGALSVGEVHAVAHITGGGIPGNLKRSLAKDCDAVVDISTWEVPRIFLEIQRLGNVDDDEMFRVLNMGIGMILIASPASSEAILSAVESAGVRSQVIGKVIPGSGRVLLTDHEDD